MNLTTDNIHSLLNDHPNNLEQKLREIFTSLTDPDVDEHFLLTFVHAIHEIFTNDDRVEGDVGFTPLGRAAVSAGIAGAAVKIAKTARSSKDYVTASYWMLRGVCHLLRTGTVKERHRLVRELLQNDLVTLCLDNLRNDFCLHRENAVATLRALAAEGLLAEHLSHTESSKVMVGMCEYTLAGPGFFVQQMGSPDTTWQINISLGNLQTMPMDEAAKYANRLYAMSQELAMWAIHGLLCHTPLPSPAFTLSLLQHNPKLIDLLFKCASLKREPWYPESEVSAIASESISQLFRAPLDLVPGVATSPNGLLPKEEDPEWKDLLACLRILVARPNWLKMIMVAWKAVETKPQEILTMLAREPQRYHAQVPPDREEFLRLFESRGIIRICIFRVISTLTHVADECGVSTADLISLLPVALKGCGVYKPLDNPQTASHDELYAHLEQSAELFRSPLYTVYTGETVDPPLQIPNQTIIGPTVFFRLLAVLARRGATPNAILKWTKLPERTWPNTTLADVQKIMRSEQLRQLCVRGLKHVTMRRETGHKRLRDSEEPDFAGFTYSSAAELAAAIIEFDYHTAGQCGTGGDLIEEIKKELVLCLGNAAEMALVLKQYKRALSFALGANVVATTEGEVVSPEIVAKNQRRINRAKSGLTDS